MTQTPGSTIPHISTATLTITANPTNLSTGSTHTGTITYIAAQVSSDTTSVTMNVTDPANLTVSPASLGFSSTQGTSNPPPAQRISVFSNPSGQPVTAKAVLNNGESWLTVSGGGTTPASITASVNPNLAPGTYSAAVAISSAANTVNVPVSYTVVDLPPQLSVSPLTESLNLTQGTSSASGQVTVSNTGGGTLQFSAQATTNQGTWLTVAGSGSGSATPSTPASLSFTADPAGLTPGLYTGQITVQDANSTAQAVIDVTMAVTQATQSITLSQSGLTFSAVAGGQPPPSQPFTISSQGTGSLSWTAQPQTISNPGTATQNWLNITPTAGSSIAGQAGTPVQVSVNPAGLTAGQYYGSVDISAPNAVNNPQSVTVLLNVTPAGQTGGNAGVSTGGLIFSGPAGSTTPQQQQVSLLNSSGATIHYSTTVFTSSGAGWLSASPASGPVPPGSASISIAADLSALPPGVQIGTVRVGFDNGSVSVIQVAAIAASGTSGSGTTSGSGVADSPVSTHALTTSSACSGGKPGYLVPIFRQPPSQSVLQVAVAQRVQLQILDDCGSPLAAQNGGGAQVSFGDRDAPINLTDVGGGIWEGTWTPVNAAAPATLQAVASEQSPGLSSIAAGTSVTVQPASPNAAGQPLGVVNAASSAQATPQIVTPGGYVAIYGTSLASNEAPLATTIPLPGTLDGTQLFLGGKPLPLLYAGSGQVNALIPQNLNPNTSYQLVIQRGSTLSVPAFLTVAEYQPGIYTLDLSGSGQGIAEIAGTTLLAAPAGNGSRPVQRGSEYLAIFATGLGPVIGSNGEAPPADGAAAPLTTIYQTTAAVTATIGGVDAPVLFSGLTPSLVGLYQVNVQVPAAVPVGDAVPLVLTVIDPVTGQSVQSNTVTLAIQ